MTSLDETKTRSATAQRAGEQEGREMEKGESGRRKFAGVGEGGLTVEVVDGERNGDLQ